MGRIPGDPRRTGARAAGQIIAPLHGGRVSIFEQLASQQHEQIVFCRNDDVGLRAIIAAQRAFSELLKNHFAAAARLKVEPFLFEFPSAGVRAAVNQRDRRVEDGRDAESACSKAEIEILGEQEVAGIERP